MLRGASFENLLLSIPAILIAITFHEFSHGYVAYRLGDPTAKMYDRLTLNPIKHFDIIGGLMLLLVGFGWAKPVPINPTYFKNYKRDTALVGLAGPAANIIISFITLIVVRILAKTNLTVDFNSYSGIILIGFVTMLHYIIQINIALAVFNLIPVPPLDGSKILMAILPERYYNIMLRYENYGMIILMLLLITRILTPILRIVSNFILSNLELLVRLIGL